MSEFDKLHDAVLLSMEHHWGEKRLCCIFLPVSHEPQPLSLTFDGVIDIHIPAMEPWGPSNSVNTISCGGDRDALDFVIEMQSGDLIKIKAKSLTSE
jgi:hypothetical protein